MKEEIRLLNLIRIFVVQALEDLNEEQLLIVPQGFNNNILWNAGHILSSQQLLTYGLSDNGLRIPSEYLGLFRKGSSPGNWTKTPDIKELTKLLIETAAIFEDDYNSNIFKTFKGYKTSSGVNLQTLEDAIVFNNFHEGLHLGIISSINKLVK